MMNKIDEIKTKIEGDPDNAEFYNELGDAHYDRNEFPAAIECYKHAIERNASVAQYHNNLGYTCYMIGRLDEAIAAYHEAIRLDPSNGLYHNNISAALAKKAGEPFK